MFELTKKPAMVARVIDLPTECASQFIDIGKHMVTTPVSIRGGQNQVFGFFFPSINEDHSSKITMARAYVSTITLYTNYLPLLRSCTGKSLLA